MAGFARKALDRNWPAVCAFALVGPLVQALETAFPHPEKGPAFVFPVAILMPLAALFLGASAVADEREGGAAEFALALPLTGNGLLARLFAAGLLPLALLAPLLWGEAWLLGSAYGTLLERGGPLGLLALVLWPYSAGFLAALVVDRFAAALGLAVVLCAGTEFMSGLFGLDLVPRWLAFSLYAIFVAQRLFAPPGYLEPSMRSARAAAGLLGFGILALALGRPFLFV